MLQGRKGLIAAAGGNLNGTRSSASKKEHLRAFLLTSGHLIKALSLKDGSRWTDWHSVSQQTQSPWPGVATWQLMEREQGQAVLRAPAARSKQNTTSASFVASSFDISFTLLG